MHVLVVGGEHAFVHGTFATKLGSVGVEIRAHWDWTIRRPPQSVPKGCDGVVVIHDMVGHHLSNAAKLAADSARVPFALVPRKFSAALPVLRQSGIVAESIPDEPTDEVSVDPDAPTLSDAPSPPDGRISDMRSAITLALEAHFEASDADITDAVCEFAVGASPPDIYREIAGIRKQMVSEWSSRKRPAAAERSLEVATAT